MLYFLKLVECVNDPAIKHAGLDNSVVPFTLLSLYGFGNALSVAHASFAVKILGALGEEGAGLLICRCGFRSSRDYSADASSRLRPVMSAGAGRWIHHVAARAQEADVAGLLARHWATGGGHWVLADHPADEERSGRILELVPRSNDDAERARARVFALTRVAALTFDDNLVDVFAAANPDTVRELVQNAADSIGIDVRPDDCGSPERR